MAGSFSCIYLHFHGGTSYISLQFLQSWGISRSPERKPGDEGVVFGEVLITPKPPKKWVGLRWIIFTSPCFGPWWGDGGDRGDARFPIGFSKLKSMSFKFSCLFFFGGCRSFSAASNHLPKRLSKVYALSTLKFLRISCYKVQVYKYLIIYLKKWCPKAFSQSIKWQK